MNIFRKALLSSVLLVAGCGTIGNPDGTISKTIAGFALPFTKAAPVHRSWYEVSSELLAPMAWCAVGMVVAGAVMVAFSKTRTAAGIFFICLGMGLTLFAALVEVAIGIVAIVSMISLLGGIGYIIWCWATGHKVLPDSVTLSHPAAD